ncbi:type II toxin-antitoxin system PemK/MazF family toxin [Aestuariivirga sp.]|uniref:type II toxin-antitoxin system PemK/MazF family toxin n=1 Tax=Aestuariivirga sp. TaxID=2650926 RepID=UPI0039E42F1E
MVAKQFYQPERGDFIWLDFTPQAGTEQAGRRPALVLSPRAFNIATGLAFACPVTSQVKGGSFEVAIPRGAGLVGVVLSDHLRSLDWVERKADFISRAPEEVVVEVTARLEAILRLDLDP